eukprot:g3175.t1
MSDDDDLQQKMDDDDYLNAMAEVDSELVAAMGRDDLPSSDEDDAPLKPRNYGAKKVEEEDTFSDTDSDEEDLPEDRPYGFKLPTEELRYRLQIKEWAERDAAGKPRLRNKTPFDSADLLPRVYFDIACGELELGRMTFVLFPHLAPKACENFRALTTGEKGVGRSGHPLSYKGSYFHRVVSGFCAQGGDTTRDDGSGGESIYGRPFQDELQKLYHHHHESHCTQDESHGHENRGSEEKNANNDKGDAAVAVKHDAPQQKEKRGWFSRKAKQEVLHHVKFKRGRIITASAGPNCNRSQFCILFSTAEWLYSKCGIIGALDSGEEILMAIEHGGTADGHPSELFHISNCGQLVLKSITKRAKLTSRHLHHDLIWVES